MMQLAQVVCPANIQFDMFFNKYCLHFEIVLDVFFIYFSS